MKFNLILFVVVICAVIVQNEAQRPTIGTLVQNFFTSIGSIFRRRPSTSTNSAAAIAAASSGSGGIEAVAIEQFLSSQGSTGGSVNVAPVVAEPVYVTVTADPIVITSMVTPTPVIERLTSIETQFEYTTSTVVETVYATEIVYSTVMQTAFVTSTVMHEPVAAEPAEIADPAEPFEAIVVQATPTARMYRPYVVKRAVEIESSEQ